ncbi:uncharacterized protein UMAG_05128 [Mycosarcoma maydis]|uniref:Uncharacterized protein n=1 Tax=Mycosarcoma maydis TaxID=5270 RepID=A0A0D1E1U9_MYCMD|nr:uncharacterized protein UMAG_05128 [Ustilago maydis 521]KIS70054.1 hypothetical protein UMAG_05128 [Ustilago maydis 521]|eukprot:XP_011388193.1 hypothetical protein UMAG_05128 [Ustilago maydis 521]
MPPVRTTPRDVLIRVPKVEPYSNSYVPPSARAKEEAKKFAAAALPAKVDDSTAEVSTSAAPDSAAPIVDPAAVSTSDKAEIAPLDTSTATVDVASDANETTVASHPTNTLAMKADSDDNEDPSQRANSPTLAFLSVDRQEEQTVNLSKAATSSAGWNSLLVWARRQRGAQWDESTALWQVDKYSREFYSFCENPATTDRSKQPGNQANHSAEPPADTDQDSKTALQATAPHHDQDAALAPTARSSSRTKLQDAATGGASPPPVPTARSIRLLRR